MESHWPHHEEQPHCPGRHIRAGERRVRAGDQTGSKREIEELANRFGTADFKEGNERVPEKRKPEFNGNWNHLHTDQHG